MNRFRIRKTADTLVIQVQEWDETRWQYRWVPALAMDRLYVANFVQEADAWLAGTDQIPDLETP